MNTVVSIMNYEPRKVKKYDLAKFNDYTEFLKQYRADGMDDGEVVDSGDFPEMNFPTEDCWQYMELDEEQQKLVDVLVSTKGYSIDEAIDKLDSLIIYRNDYQNQMHMRLSRGG